LGTGIDLNAEAWLSEGLAQYLAVQYYERRYAAFAPNLFEFGSPGIIEELVKQQFGFFNLREHFIELPYLMTQYVGFDEALVKPIEKVRFSNVSDVRLYDKGYLVARAIASWTRSSTPGSSAPAGWIMQSGLRPANRPEAST
jgi:hypothetical protein